jgi:alkylation response protein AidB-like acyl-CoA dehydrogenase
MQAQLKINRSHWLDQTHTLGKEFADRSAAYDRNAVFVQENYDALKEHRYFSAIIPGELGGENVPYSEMCDIIRTIGQYCGSTALALSMHQHLLAANIWKYKKGQGGEAMLTKVAAQQLVLVSTGARDWLESNGEVKRTQGGYLMSAQKYFASQSSVGDMLVTSAPYQDPERGWEVLHFPVPFNSKGVTVMNDWYTMGMRGTGSHTVKLENVFVAESAIVLRRPRGEFHPFWNVVLTVAMPLIMSAYVGIAERAAQIAVRNAKSNKARKPHIAYLIGEMHNELTAAEVQLRDMIQICNEYDFEPLDSNGQDILARKVNVANACIRTVTKAIEIVGGQSFYQSFGLERLFRDVQGANFHPLPEKDQQSFSGEYILNRN